MNDSKNYKMSEMFKGYSNYSQEEYDNIWKTALIVIDTNILLNLYRYSKDTRQELLNALKALKDRIWIPYYVAKEYYSNKNNVIFTSYDEYKILSDSIKKSFKDIENEINQHKSTQLDCKTELISILEESNKKICSLLEKEKEEKKPHYESNPIEEEILSLFDNSVGQPFSEEEFEKVKKEGLKRIENKIPPGYKDKDKIENGDYYIFYSLIKKSKEIKNDIIFVTDDVKEDWFNIINEEKHGGRYELLNEFYQETGKLLLLYSSDGFMKAYGKNIIKKDINKEIVDELINTRNMYSIFYDYNNYNYYNSIISKLREAVISNSPKAIKYIDELIPKIKKLNIPESQKYNYTNALYNFEHNMIEDTYYDKEDLINLLDSLKYKNTSYRETSNHKNDYIYIYQAEIQILKYSKGKLEIMAVYKELVAIVKQHIKQLDDFFSRKYHTLYLSLTNILDFLQDLIEKNDIRQSAKNDIIDKLEEIIKLL